MLASLAQKGGGVVRFSGFDLSSYPIFYHKNNFIVAQKNIYALLVAINDYPAGINGLSGCIADKNAFHDYLHKQYNTEIFQFKPFMLENAAATRDAVIAGFQHFQPATEGDVCVFFYSGHGSRIPTVDFWEAQDDFNEALVCYDKCLVDKELSCLIYEMFNNKQGVHFLSVMDSCHSGGATRGVDEDDAIAREGVKIRMSNPSNYPKSITEYYGFDKNLYTRREDGKYHAEKAQHINFSACRNHQTAKETIINFEFRGAFTASLIEALETSHSLLSYVDLERRVSQKIGNRVAEQLPFVDAISGANPQGTFMGGAIAPKNRFFVSWNAKFKAWELNAGAYHGMHMDGETPSVVKLISEDIAFILDDISASTSTGEWQSETFLPDLKKQYDVVVQVGGGQTRKTAFSTDCHLNSKDLVSTNFTQAQTTYVQMTGNLEEAEFFIHTSNDAIWLRRKGEEKPIFQPVKATVLDMSHTLDFWKKVDSVMQWFHLKNLDNPTTSIKTEELSLTLYRSENIETWWEVQPENMERVGDWAHINTFTFRDKKPPSFALSIENTGSRTLFCSGLVMSGRFGIDNEYLQNVKLIPAQKVFMTLNDSGISTHSIGLSINDTLYEMGVREQIDYIKVLVSTDDLNTQVFVQEPLNIEGAAPATREVLKMIGRSVPIITKPDWISFLIPLHIVRP
jgi:hypothetical protein